MVTFLLPSKLQYFNAVKFISFNGLEGGVCSSKLYEMSSISKLPNKVAMASKCLRLKALRERFSFRIDFWKGPVNKAMALSSDDVVDVEEA